MKSPIWRMIAGFILLLVIVGIVVALVNLWEIVTAAVNQFMLRFPISQSVVDWAMVLLIVLLLSYALGNFFFRPRVNK